MVLSVPWYRDESLPSSPHSVLYTLCIPSVRVPNFLFSRKDSSPIGLSVSFTPLSLHLNQSLVP